MKNEKKLQTGANPAQIKALLYFLREDNLQNMRENFDDVMMDYIDSCVMRDIYLDPERFNILLIVKNLLRDLKKAEEE